MLCVYGVSFLSSRSDASGAGQLGPISWASCGEYTCTHHISDTHWSTQQFPSGAECVCVCVWGGGGGGGGGRIRHMNKVLVLLWLAF